MEYGVPGDVDIADLDDIGSPEELVYGIVSWSAVEQIAEQTDADGEEHQHMRELWFPAVVDPCSGGAWHGPGSTYFGPMHIFDSRKQAVLHAMRLVKRLRKQRTELERGLEGLTVEAATEHD
jgi:hypothetical protein